MWLELSLARFPDLLIMDIMVCVVMVANSGILQENARMPLCLPPDSPVSRVRLPGRGLGSQWRYTLKGKERVKVAANYSVKLKTLGLRFGVLHLAAS